MHPINTDNLSPSLRPLNQIRHNLVRWIWPARIPRGRLTLLIGEPGVGKSLLAADIAARISTGNPWPDPDPLTDAFDIDSFPDLTAPETPPADSKYYIDPRIVARALRNQSRYYKGNVLIIAPEDDLGDTLKPRLAAAGAHLPSIWSIDGLRPTPIRASLDPAGLRMAESAPPPLPITLPDHADLLAQAVRAVDRPSLLILDPLHALLSPAALSSPSLAATAIACLTDIARRYEIAILAIGHLTKMRTGRTLYRARGALALVAAARSVLLLAPDPCEPSRRILASLKSVYCALPASLAFRVVPGPGIEWESANSPASLASLRGFSSGSLIPPDLLDLAPEVHSALAEACLWLADSLSSGDRTASELIAAARDAGINVATLRRAKRLLAIRSYKPSNDAAWHWSDPASANGAASRPAAPAGGCDKTAGSAACPADACPHPSTDQRSG